MTIAFISKIFIKKVWHSKNIFSVLLLPLSWLYIFFIRIRSLLYSIGFFSITKINVPVIIVGNIVIGGSGKTPLVIWLSKYFKKKGHIPGIISRGYGGTYSSDTQFVKPTSDPLLVGDEPVLIAKNTHYSLARDIEIVVIDGEDPFGNCYCLPAGPCREPKLKPFFSADFIVNTYRGYSDIPHSALIDHLEVTYNKLGLTVQPKTIKRYIYKELKSVMTPSKTLPISDLHGKTLHAVAGIHDPSHFFSYLRNHKFNLIIHQFSDHHIFTKEDIKFDDNFSVVMTEKDAVKCSKFSDSRHWYVPVDAELTESFADALDNYMEKILNG